MEPMKDFLNVNLNNGSNNNANEVDVENTVENPSCYTVEDNHVSLISENVETVIKVETDLLDDCMWQSGIDIDKYGEELPDNVHQDTSNSNLNSNPESVNHNDTFLCYKCGDPFASSFGLEHHLELHENLTQNVSSCNGDIINIETNSFLCYICGEDFDRDFDFRNHLEGHNKKTQNATENNSNLNCEDENFPNSFCCDICGKCFSRDFDLDSHIREHIKLTQSNNSFKCNFCEKEFKLNFILNRHIKSCHKSNDSNDVVNMSECRVCKIFVDDAKYDEHVRTHTSSPEKDTDFIVNLKLSKLNGVWKSKPNFIYKCNICDDRFQNEIHLTEHMKIHKISDHKKQSKDGLNTTLISRSDNCIQQIHDNNLKCQKCNLRFEKKDNLDLHIVYCTKTSRNIWGKFLDSQNVKKVPVICTVCGISFNSSQLLNKHKTSECNRLHNCTFCEKTFDTKELCSKHVEVCRKNNKCESNINKSGVSEAQNQNIHKNTSILNLRKENSQCSTLIARKMSDLLDCTANVNQSFTVPSNLVMTNNTNKRFKMSCSNVSEKTCSVAESGNGVSKQTALNNLVNENNTMNVSKTKSLCLNGALPIEDTANTNENVQVVRSNFVINECHSLVKREIDLGTTVNEMNSLDQVNSPIMYPSSVSETHNVLPNNCSLNIKKERGANRVSAVSNNFLLNSFNPLDAANSSTWSTESIEFTETNQPIVKREHDNSESNIVQCIIRETTYFTVKETTFKGKHQNYEQVIQIQVLCVCKLCKKSFTNLHTLALHMSNHQECSMHECVVCDETFKTVLLWTNHMNIHQRHEDIMPEAQNNLVIAESNVLDLFDESTDPETVTTVGNQNNEPRLGIKQELTTLAINPKRLKQPDIEFSVSPHQTVNSISKSYSCKYCNRTFSGQGPLTNHEKSHTNPSKNNLLLPGIDDTLTNCNQEETDFDMQTTNNVDNSVTTQSQISRNSVPKRFVCHYCRKRFVKKCHRTNHMRIVHKHIPQLITPKTNNVEIDDTSFTNAGEQSLNPSPNVESIQDNINSSFVSVSTNLDKNSVNSKNNNAYCTICQKQFAHIGALTSHMHIHSNHKPLKCRYCNRKFNMKGPYTLHMRTHKRMMDAKNVQTQNLSTVKVEMMEVKDNEEQLQLDPKENFNNPKFLDVNSNDNLNCTSFLKKNRMWFVCDVCGKKFSTPFQIILHRRLRHDGIIPYICKICNKSYDVRHCWNKHLKSHYRKNGNISNLKNGHHTNDTRIAGHLKSEQQQKHFKCGYCKKEYNLIFHWQKHLSLNKICRRHCLSNVPEVTSVQAKNKYTESTRFECHVCKKTFSTDYNRKVHMINFHHIENFGTDRSVDMQVQDPLTIKTPIRLDVNIPNQKSRIRNSNTPFKCKVCGKCYSNVNNLSRHRNLAHTSAHGNVTCKICGSIFKHKYTFREHCRIKHKFLLKEKNGLKLNAIISSNGASQHVPKIENIIDIPAHTETQHAENILYECKDCSEIFDTNIILGQHIFQNHTVNKNTPKRLDETIVDTPSTSDNSSSVKCNICFKSFSSMSYLSKHMLMHSGIKPFKCNVCHMPFRFKANLMAHQKKHNIVTVT